MRDGTPLEKLLIVPSYRQQLLEHLREQIISGQLAPGSSLTPTTLAKRLRTSAMPVREALRALEQEGLVEVSARRFTRVAVPRRDVADEAYPLLGTLEGHVLKDMSASARDLAEATRANEALGDSTTPAERLRADIRFHRAITAGSKPITLGFLSTLYGRIALLEVGYHQAYSPDESVSEHDALLEALERRDGRLAATLVKRHWSRGYAAVVALFASEGEFEIEAGPDGPQAR